MNILIALFDPLDLEDTLTLADQFTHRFDQNLTILSIADNAAKASYARQSLTKAQNKMNKPGISTRLIVGDPLKSILAEIDQGGIELLIIGEHFSQEYGFLHRSNLTDAILDHSPCAVLVAKGKARPIRRILLCDSGAEHPLLGRFVVQVSDLLGGEEEVTVLHVMSQISAGPGVRGKQLRAGADELIEEGAPEGKLLLEDIQLLGRPGIHPTAKVRHGLVVDEIQFEAHQGDYDLVVIGTHQIKGWQHILLEDLAKEILHAMDRPVLVVR